MKKVLLLGFDGYIGTPLTLRLLEKGYDVIGIDSGLRRDCVQEMGSSSATNILSREEKSKRFIEKGNFVGFTFDIYKEPERLDIVIRSFSPDVIVNLAHIPSGPYSMRDREFASLTLQNNIVGTNNILWSIKENCPNCHYITIGTTGEYSHYSNIAIEEGYFQINWEGRLSEKMIYPRKPTSIYHTSKVGSTYLIDYLCRIWDLKATDIMQGVVFGLYTPECDREKIFTRFDSDEAFGTVLNRFIIQALLGKDLTIYGEGKHQRGFISLNDSIQALEIAIENEPKKGEARVWNQLSSWHSINDIAKNIQEVSGEFGISAIKTRNIDTLRHEYTGEHFYQYKTEILKSLGYVPTRNIKEEIRYCMKVLKDIDLSRLEDNILPKIKF